MEIDDVLTTVRSLPDTSVLAPGPGSGAPEIAWGDYFFSYAPRGETPTGGQPFATVVTKDYPDEPSSGLGADGRWRVNVHVGTPLFEELTGQQPRAIRTEDFAATDVVLPHPTYGALGWVCVVNPGEQTSALVVDLITRAHQDAATRFHRRRAGGGSD